MESVTAANELQSILYPNNSEDAAGLKGNSLPPNGTEEVDVECLDYGYIGACKNVPELERILAVLQSGREGIYPHLIEFTQERLYTLAPKKRIPKNVVPEGQELQSVLDDLQAWQQDMKQAEQQSSRRPMKKAQPIQQPPVETTNFPALLPTSTATTTSTSATARIASGDYRAWDRFHADEYEPAREHSTATKLASSDHALPKKVHQSIEQLRQATLPLRALQRLVEQEKRKGDECVRAKEYKEAVQYYSRCVELLSEKEEEEEQSQEGLLLAAYSNRSLAHLKLHHYDQCVHDTTQALQLQPTHFKCLLRRGIAHHQCGRYQDAMADFQRALLVDPEHQEAQRFLAASQTKFEQVGGIPSMGVSTSTSTTATTKQRMLIQEEQEQEEQEVEEGMVLEEPVRLPGCLADEESDISSDEDEDDQERDGTTKLVQILP